MISFGCIFCKKKKKKKKKKEGGPSGEFLIHIETLTPLPVKGSILAHTICQLSEELVRAIPREEMFTTPLRLIYTS